MYFQVQGNVTSKKSSAPYIVKVSSELAYLILKIAYLTSGSGPKKRKLYASSGPIAYAVSGPRP